MISKEGKIICIWRCYTSKTPPLYGLTSEEVIMSKHAK